MSAEYPRKKTEIVVWKRVFHCRLNKIYVNKRI